MRQKPKEHEIQNNKIRNIDTSQFERQVLITRLMNLDLSAVELLKCLNECHKTIDKYQSSNSKYEFISDTSFNKNEKTNTNINSNESRNVKRTELEGLISYINSLTSRTKICSPFHFTDLNDLFRDDGLIFIIILNDVCTSLNDMGFWQLILKEKKENDKIDSRWKTIKDFLHILDIETKGEIKKLITDRSQGVIEVALKLYYRSEYYSHYSCNIENNNEMGSEPSKDLDVIELSKIHISDSVEFNNNKYENKKSSPEKVANNETEMKTKKYPQARVAFANNKALSDNVSSINSFSLSTPPASLLLDNPNNKLLTNKAASQRPPVVKSPTGKKTSAKPTGKSTLETTHLKDHLQFYKQHLSIYESRTLQLYKFLKQIVLKYKIKLQYPSGGDELETCIFICKELFEYFDLKYFKLGGSLVSKNLNMSLKTFDKAFKNNENNTSDNKRDGGINGKEYSIGKQSQSTKQYKSKKNSTDQKHNQCLTNLKDISEKNSFHTLTNDSINSDEIMKSINSIINHKSAAREQKPKPLQLPDKLNKKNNKKKKDKEENTDSSWISCLK
ncbi:hypothetical protein CDIK_0687 [Cucumispora dikerogammari]|nr:hypothetical protein CDIK_0687 [Cucumispora dikerogammari]